MRARGTATMILTVGLLGASLTAFLTALSVTVLSEPVLAASAAPMLDTERVREPIRRRTGDALLAAVPTVATLDTETRDRLTDSVLDQSAFVDGFSGALGSVSRHVFDGETGPIVIDPAAVAASTVAAFAEIAPDTAVTVPADSFLVVTVDAEPIPRLDGWDRVIRIAAVVIGAVSVVAIALGIALADTRLEAFARVGRWCIGIGLGVLTVFWFAPTLLLPFLGGWPEVGGIALGGNGAFLVPSLVAIGVGVFAIYLANRLSRLQREYALRAVPLAPTRRVTDAERRIA